MNITHRDPRLLAIDDSEMIHRLLRARLKHEGLEMHSATSGPTGLEMARSLLPDVILLDLEMPGMDGYAVLAALKTDGATREIPIIFLSGSGDTDDKVRGLDMGAIDFITKPFDLAELRARVRSAIRIHQLIRMLAQRAQIDGLTGLWNRSYLDERLMQEVALAQRHATPLAFILCDLDRFKNLNDKYGHPFGDRVLEEFARLLNEGRQTDVHCRYGGEEFGIVLPSTRAEDARLVADRIRAQLEAVRWPQYPQLVVTVSMGVADLGCADQQTFDSLIAAADGALYEAKKNGRNRVELAPPVPGNMKLSA